METTERILEVWLWRALRPYPCQTAEFLARERDPFRNPVGHRLRQALQVLLEDALGGGCPDRTEKALDSIAQLRAVEDITPAAALAFLFQLKPILRAQCPEAAWETACARIDEMALEAFSLYMNYREKSYTARANEARRRIFFLERRPAPDTESVWQERGDT